MSERKISLGVSQKRAEKTQERLIKAQLKDNAETDAVAPGDTSLVSGVTSDPIPAPLDPVVPVAWQAIIKSTGKDCGVTHMESLANIWRGNPALTLRPLYASPQSAGVSEAEVIERLRKHVLKKVMTQQGGILSAWEHTAWECKECDGRWPRYDEEKHSDNCVASLARALATPPVK